MINAIVFGLAVALISFICYWFFGNHHEQAGNSTIQNNEQHATVVVKGGYSPSTLILKQGVPAKVNFDMQDSTACLAHVVFEKLGGNFLTVTHNFSYDRIPRKANLIIRKCPVLQNLLGP